MNIFFYTASRSDAAKHYLEQLQGLPVLQEMMVLTGGALFQSPLALKLRSGDLVILFASNSQELDELLTLRNEFIDFRIVLILGESLTLRKAYSLQPRFIAFQDEQITKIEGVIQKIKGTDESPVHL